MRRAVLVACGGLAWWLMSCRDIPSPDDGVFAISQVILPSPGLVVNDTMRDSLGLVAPLQVIAFDADGLPISGAQATFAALDSGAHFAGALMIGDDTVATFVVGNIAGLQTDSVRVPVTLVPQLIVAGSEVRPTLTVPLTDTSATSPELTTRVVNRQGLERGIEAIIVSYQIVQAPAPTPGSVGPTVVLFPGVATAARDTTDPSGSASARARFRFLAIPTTTDSALINATASYRGQSLGTVQFTVVFTKQ
jgi:hypothetical protein